MWRATLPPFMTPFVLIADIDRAVMDVTAVVVRISRTDSPAKEIIDKYTLALLNSELYFAFLMQKFKK